MQILRLAIVMMMLSSVCCCSPYDTNFDDRCKGSEGQKCMSVSKINMMVNLGLIRDEDDIPNEISKKPKKEATQSKAIKKKRKFKKKEFDIWLTGEDKFI